MITKAKVAKEVEANRFAFYLLMPEQMVLEDIKTHGNLDLMEANDEFVNMMAKKYGVEPSVVTIRLQMIYFDL